MKKFFLFFFFVISLHAEEEKKCFDYQQSLNLSFLPKNLKLSVQATSININEMEFAFDSKANLWTYADKKGWAFRDAGDSWKYLSFSDEMTVVAAEKGSAALILDTVGNIRGTFAFFKDALLGRVKPKIVKPFAVLPAAKYEVKVIEPVKLSNDPQRGLPSREWSMGQISIREKGGHKLIFQSSTLFMDRQNSLGMGAERLPISGYQIVSVLDNTFKPLGTLRAMRMNQKWTFEVKAANGTLDLKEPKTFSIIDCSQTEELGRGPTSLKKKNKK